MAAHPSLVGPEFPCRARSARRLLAGALLIVPSLACADPDGKFDDFVRRMEANQPPEPDAAPPPPTPDGGLMLTPEQVTGTFLSVTSTSVSPKKPVVYKLDVEGSLVDGALRLTLVDQPLAYWDRMTPVGMPSEPHVIDVTAQGTYTDERIGTVTPKDANPVTFAESKSDTVFMGRLDAAEIDPATGQVMFWCGTVTGMVYVPMIPFTGNFTITRIVDNADYPDAVIDCAKTPADPPPEKK